MRQDVLKTYKDVHSWVGIIAGMFLFIAFWAGALTMFKEPLIRWATPPAASFSAPTPIEQTDELIARTVAAYPKAAKGYTVVLEPGPDSPSRLYWNEGGRRDPKLVGANLSSDGKLEVAPIETSRIGYLVDELHRRVGLPLPNSIAMPITTIVALLYFVAIISGVICLLPSLTKDLFALRVSHNLKRMWLDLHNVLGFFSLPFHIVIALTTVVFAFHDQIYDVQDKLIYQDNIEARWEDHEHPPSPDPSTPLLPVPELLARLKLQAPGFRPVEMNFRREVPDHGGHMALTITGHDDRYGHRSATVGYGTVDATTGKLVETDLMPGFQPPLNATLSGFFTLHFGSFGGLPVRWGYFLMGLVGTIIFYTGNLVWIESRRKRERRGSGPVTQSRQTFVLAALTVGVCLGAIAGTGFSIAAAKWLPGRVGNVESWHIGIYYAVFLGSAGWAFARGAARGSGELLAFAALALAAIPLSTLFAPGAWSHADMSLLVDWMAAGGALALLYVAHLSRQRSRQGQKDSVWLSTAVDGQTL